MKVILTGGGTAGHVNPALAIAEELLYRDKQCEILFIGREGGGENSTVERLGLPTKYLKVRGLERRLTLRNLEALRLAIRAKSEAERIIKEFKPDIAIGTGGYVCWPVLRAAASLGVPTLIHESNVSAGLTARALSRKCTAVLLNHRETAGYFPHAKEIITVGNPLRRGFSALNRDNARRALGISMGEVFIVSVGGSGGAKKINDACISVMKNYSSQTRGIKHVHASGKKYFDGIDCDSFKKGVRGSKIIPYIEDMPLYLGAADIIVTRCGAVTLSEIALVGTPAILIPSPNVTDNHQYKNASLLEKAGAAMMIPEEKLSEETLTDKIRTLAESRERRRLLSEKIKSFASPGARGQIADIIERTVSESKFKKT